MKDSNKKSEKSSSDSENPVKKIIPEMPKDKRTKAYKDWVKQYGNEKIPSKKTSTKDEAIRIKSSEVKKTKPKVKKDNLEELINSFIDFVNN